MRVKIAGSRIWALERVRLQQRLSNVCFVDAGGCEEPRACLDLPRRDGGSTAKAASRGVATTPAFREDLQSQS